VTGVTGLEFPPVAIAFGISMWSLLIGGVVSMVKRFRRSAADVRAQIKWVGYALVLFMVSATLGLAVLQSAGILLNALTALFVPVSVTLAITRFRLYDIDRIVSRTVTYGLVALVLGGLFALLALVPTIVLGAAEFADIPSWFVALTTLVVFALFSPVRRRVQRRVDRRFNRSRYDAEAVVEGFARETRDQTELARVTVGLGVVVGSVFQPGSLDLWLHRDARGSAETSSTAAVRNRR
jgi:hypothetical protein